MVFARVGVPPLNDGVVTTAFLDVPLKDKKGKVTGHGFLHPAGGNALALCRDCAADAEAAGYPVQVVEIDGFDLISGCAWCGWSSKQRWKKSDAD